MGSSWIGNQPCARLPRAANAPREKRIWAAQAVAQLFPGVGTGESQI